MVLQQCRLGHSWITGHPHSLLYKPATAVNQSSKNGAGSCGSGNSASTGTSSYGQPSGGSNYNNSKSNSSSFLDFAGNSRYQAYTLARFSTLSVASTSASSSSFSSSSSSSGQAGSLGSQVAGSSSIRQEPTDSASDRHHEDRAHSNPADAQSPEASSTSTTPSTSSSSNTTSSLPTSLASSSSPSATKKEHDDTEDAWAVNESYSGHASSSNPTSSSEESKDDPSKISSRPDVTSSKTKDPAAIDASWRRTSDSIPSTPFSSNSVLSPSSSPSSSSSKAGGLDLSSSTLVQQMLFKERAPHADSYEGKSQQDQQQHSKEESSATHTQSFSSTTDSTASSPSLASMLLSQSSGDASESRKAKAAPAKEDEDHISKLDIRVGIVRSVTRHPDAESLYIEQVDVGDKENGEVKEPRTIVSGLVRHVPKEYLEGRAVIVVGNMKPSKLRGVMSQGMLLCAMEQDEKGEVTKVGLLEPAEGSQAGDKVTIEGFTDSETIPAAVLTPKKKWFEKSRIHFSVHDGVAYYKGSPFKTVHGLVRCKSISKGEIS
ncbi:hypothetical protein BGZ96_007895 [Linnemannia gamsii]|uniref:tRNA-binding domain-containing protein n=1 Tax=Linnemannia gamsii TaxID=64522 RepID=A0ABQ7KE90_9FUNG|nr:hypothetical protein BGZ96_007895 [Linnemannia gamsii]